MAMLEEAKSFYDGLLGFAGITPLFEHPAGGRIYGMGGLSKLGYAQKGQW